MPRGQFSLRSLFAAILLVALLLGAARILLAFPQVLFFGAVPAAFVLTLFIPWFLSGRIESPALFLIATISLSLAAYAAAFFLLLVAGLFVGRWT